MNANLAKLLAAYRDGAPGYVEQHSEKNGVACPIRVAAWVAGWTCDETTKAFAPSDGERGVDALAACYGVTLDDVRELGHWWNTCDNEPTLVQLADEIERRLA